MGGHDGTDDCETIGQMYAHSTVDNEYHDDDSMTARALGKVVFSTTGGMTNGWEYQTDDFGSIG